MEVILIEQKVLSKNSMIPKYIQILCLYMEDSP